MCQDDDGLAQDADRVVIAVNPVAGAGSADDRAVRLARLLDDHGFGVQVLDELSEVASEANRWHREGRLRCLVGVGGDGTAAELTNRTDPGVPLTMLPTGTENLLARYLGLDGNPNSLLKTITLGKRLRLDAAEANGRIFLLMMGCGFDADVVCRVHSVAGRHNSYLAWIKPIIESIHRYEFPGIRVYWDEEDGGPVETQSLPVVVRWLFAFNLPCYGAGLRFTPRADGADGLLDVCTFRRGSLWHGLRYLTAVKLGRHQRLADCMIRRVRRVRITSEREVPYQLDGDPAGLLPVDIGVLPGRLTMVVPP